MGQRLNIEINENGITLANAYYHWSAYTSSSLDLLESIMENIATLKKGDPVIYAVRLLEKTGALLQPDELTFAKENHPKETFEIATDRSDGLIQISEKGMQETRNWEESRIEIHLDEEVIYFGVYSLYDKESYLQNYEEPEEAYQDLPVHSLNMVDFPFDEFAQFAKKLNSIMESDISSFRTPNGDVIRLIV